MKEEVRIKKEEGRTGTAVGIKKAVCFLILLIGAGFAIHWTDRISTYAYYDGELFRTNYLSNNVSARFRLTF